MSNEPYSEYGNTLPKRKEKTPFKLGENECIIRYLYNDIVMYFKITNIIEKQAIQYPSAPQNKH